MTSLDVDAVKAFVAIADLKSFTRAADALGTTQGAIVYRAFGLDPTDTTTFHVLAVGIGTRCTLVGRNAYGIAISEATTADDVTPNGEFAYRRPIALFRVSDTSQYFAEFIGTVTSYGKTAANLRTFIQ